MRKKWLSHHSHMLRQAYSVFQIKTACDPLAVEMGRDCYWIIPSNPRQIKSPDLRDIHSLPVLAHCESTLQGMQLPAAPLESESQEIQFWAGASLLGGGILTSVCVFLLWWWLFHPPIPFQRHNGVIVFPTEDFPFEKNKQAEVSLI